MARKPTFNVPAAVEAVVLGKGGTKHSGGPTLIGEVREFRIETKAGTLRVIASERSILCRFEDVDRSIALLGYDPHGRLSRTGKWNWHMGSDSNEARSILVEGFGEALSRLLVATSATTSPTP